MEGSKSYLVLLHSKVIPYLKSVGMFAIDNNNGYDYMACSKIQSSLLPGLLDVTISRHHLWNSLDVDFLISLPIHYVIYVCFAKGEDIRITPGFRNEP